MRAAIAESSTPFISTPSNSEGFSASSQVDWIGIGVNDPSAGSPTETLLRLLLPLNDKV